MRGRFFVIGLTALTALTPAAAQQPGGEPAAQTVRIDATVVDGRGQPVANLKPNEVELREDTRVVSLDDVRFVKIDPASTTDAPPQPVASHGDELREAKRANTRLVAIFIDEYHISADAADRTRQALNDLLDHTLGPRDLVIVMKPLDSLFAIRLTHDRDAAKQIVADFEGRKGDYTPRTDYERNSWAGTPGRIEASRTQVVVSALNALALHMGSLADTRKTMFVVTEGFAGPPRRRGQEFLATPDVIVRSANRSNVSIYPIDPRADAAAAAAAQTGAATVDEGAVLRRLAADTNGRVVSSADDLTTAVRRGLDAASAYYLLTYHGVHPEDGKFHAVQVRVTRPGVRVSARAGYWAPSIDDRLTAQLLARASAPLPPIKLEPARHISPFIQPWFGLSLGSNGKTRVSFVWEPAGHVPGERLARTASRLVLTALASDDSVLYQGPVLPTGAGSMDDSEGTPNRAVFEAPPGRLRLRMRVEDAALQPLDADVRDIPIRDFAKGVTIGTPEIIRARNEREFRALDEDATAIPVSSREFSRTEHLLIRFLAYAPGTESPTVTARLLNRGGQPMRTLEIEKGPHGEHQCDLLLSSFASGDYQLELVATSPSGQTRELVDFRVTS